MRAAIRSIQTLIGEPLEAHQPADVFNFRETVRMSVRPLEGNGEDTFDVTVCSPRWLDEACQRTGYEFSHGCLVLRRWDAEPIHRALHEKVSRAEGGTWEEIAKQLGRFSQWEFEL